MAFDWDKEEQNAGGSNFIEYVPNGEYKVKLDKVEIKDNVAWKSPMVIFNWQEGEYKYPRSASHPLAISNPSFRRVHMRNILMEFGIAKETAQKLIEQAETDEAREKLAKGYETMFARVAQKHMEVDIIVRTQMRNGKPVTSEKGTVLSESDFASPHLQLGRKQQTAPTSVSTTTTAAPVDDGLFGEEATDIKQDEIPF